MDKVAMLRQMIEVFGHGKISRFAKELGVTRQCVASWLKRGTFDAELIYGKLPGISPGWLLSGKGSMKDSKDLNVVDVLLNRIDELNIQLYLARNYK